MEFKNKTQGQVQAADILMDMPVETMQRLLRQMGRSEYYADKTEFPDLAVWLTEVLNWKIQMKDLLHANEMARQETETQRRIDKALENSVP